MMKSPFSCSNTSIILVMLMLTRLSLAAEPTQFFPVLNDTSCVVNSNGVDVGGRMRGKRDQSAAQTIYTFSAFKNSQVYSSILPNQRGLAPIGVAPIDAGMIGVALSSEGEGMAAVGGIVLSAKFLYVVKIKSSMMENFYYIGFSDRDPC